MYLGQLEGHSGAAVERERVNYASTDPSLVLSRQNQSAGDSCDRLPCVCVRAWWPSRIVLSHYSIEVMRLCLGLSTLVINYVAALWVMQSWGFRRAAIAYSKHSSVACQTTFSPQWATQMHFAEMSCCSRIFSAVPKFTPDASKKKNEYCCFFPRAAAPIHQTDNEFLKSAAIAYQRPGCSLS